jgi:hypothetical protein
MKRTSVSRSYVGDGLFTLAGAICSWCVNENIHCTIPVALHHEGRYYLRTQFGYCPQDSGTDGYFAYDEMNDEFCYWETEQDEWDREKDASDNLEMIEPKRFDTLSDLESYVLTGE